MSSSKKKKTSTTMLITNRDFIFITIIGNDINEQVNNKNWGEGTTLTKYLFLFLILNDSLKNYSINPYNKPSLGR